MGFGQNKIRSDRQKVEKYTSNYGEKKGLLKILVAKLFDSETYE